MELARAWFTAPAPVVPPELAALLASRSETADIVLSEGWPELITQLPERGEGRNHDLVLLGTGTEGSVLVAIEAKVDESMGPSIGEYRRASKGVSNVSGDAAAPLEQAPSRAQRASFAWRRIDTLLQCVFGDTADATKEPSECVNDFETPRVGN
jgi:hypothetical protein